MTVHRLIRSTAARNGSPQLGDPGRDIRIGALVTIAFFGVLLGWAAFAPLDAGVHASGTIAVSGHRQAVQHRQGGEVIAIHTREGQRVRGGQLLLELAAPDLKATERALTSDYLALLAQRVRLLAEFSGQSNFAPPPQFASLTGENRHVAEQALQLQLEQMRARAAALRAEQSVLGQRSRQLDEQRFGYSKQRSSLREQQRIMEEELHGLRQLEKKGFASGTRVRAVERVQEELRGRESAMMAEAARAGEGMGETRMQSLALARGRLEEVAGELRDVQARLSEVLPKLMSAREQLQRSNVRAPVSGQVVGMTAFTVGGVVAPGQMLMEIVPENRALVIQAQVDPAYGDDIYKGQNAQVRFISVDDNTLPLLSGRVRLVSADSLTDKNSGLSYFQAEIEVDRAELNRVRDALGRGQLRAGLPVEVVMAIRKRTALQYLVEPLTGHFWRALREQ